MITNAGGVTKIEGRKYPSPWRLLYSSTNTTHTQRLEVVSLTLKKTAFPIDELNITGNVGTTWWYIDAIQLVGMTVPPFDLLTCEPGWIKFYDSCYTVGRYNETWITAENHCTAIGSKLVEIESKEEGMFLRTFLLDRHLDNHRDVSYWLGAMDMQKEGYWVWVHDRVQLNYTMWQPGQPDNTENAEHCLRMSGEHDFRWEDADCLTKAAFICERKSYIYLKCDMHVDGSDSCFCSTITIPNENSFSETRLFDAMISIRAPESVLASV